MFTTNSTPPNPSWLASRRSAITNALLADREQELAALRKELATMTASRDTEKGMKSKARLQRDSVTWRLSTVDRRLANAERRNAEIEKNAARYIWLRDKSESVHQFYLSTPIWFTGVKFNPETVDSTIDAVMTQPTESGASE